jgi:hypothetical protein
MMVVPLILRVEFLHLTGRELPRAAYEGYDIRDLGVAVVLGEAGHARHPNAVLHDPESSRFEYFWSSGPCIAGGEGFILSRNSAPSTPGAPRHGKQFSR